MPYAAFSVSNGMSLDVQLFEMLHGFAGVNSALDFFIIFGARLLPYLLVAAVIIFPFTVLEAESRTAKQKVYGLLFAFVWASIARFLITPGIRAVSPQARPFVEGQFTPLIPHEASASFPSGHAVFFFALATATWFYHRKLGYLLGALALVMVVARVAAGVHWPSDVLFGALIGIGSALLGRALERLMSKKKPAAEADDVV
jgi:undecaprenyl-diphosphatase